MANLAQRFEALVDRGGPHHLWLGSTDERGIPQMRVDGRLTTARRVAWEFDHGPLPFGVRVRGCSADPRCVRGDHLTISSPKARPHQQTRVRRHRGDGSLRETRPGVWQLAITTGTNRRVFRTITGDHYEAAHEMARLALEHGRAPSNIDALVAVYLVHLNDVGRSRATLRRYEQLWRTWLSPMCGATTPDQLCRSDIEAALGAMHDAGQSQRSIHQAAVVLNTTLAWAKQNGLAAANVVLGCRLPDGSAITAARRRR